MQLEESVTLFDDNKVENRFAELQITADGITSEVSRKVGNDEVISRINQTAESVKIQADKINIDGIITAVNDNTTTTIDGDKITTGTLSAGAVNADSGQFNTALIPDLNADKITSGDILANRMSTNLVSAFQAVVSDLKALAATIGGFFIGDTDIHTKNVAITSNADNSVGLSSSVFTRTINGTPRSNLKFAIGSKFGVDKSGTLYANGANVTSISADNISTGTINTSRLNANEIKTQIVQTADLNASKITAGTISDSSGKNYWNLGTGRFVTKQGTIADFGISNSSLTAEGSTSTVTTRIAMNGTDLSAERIGRTSSLYNGFKISGDYIRSRFLSTDGTLLTGLNLGGMTGITLIRDSAYSGSDVWASTTSAGSIWSYANGIMVTPSNIFMVLGDFMTSGSKSRNVETDNYQNRLLYCYETPTPLFGDIGEATIGDDGVCYVDIDDIFGETISDITEYQVFLQKEGNGDCWIANKQQKYFVIQGTPNMKVGWELKAKQRGYHNIRLESADNKLDEYEDVDNNYLLENYINEQEELLYGNY